MKGTNIFTAFQVRSLEHERMSEIPFALLAERWQTVKLHEKASSK